MSIKISEFKTSVHNDWCPGCGDFGIVNAIQMALAKLNIPRDKSAVFSGIGCSGKTAHFINVNGIHVPHGRLLTYAQGAKLSNPAMTVIGVAGDGDGLGIGSGHLVAAGRRNIDMTYLIFDNGVYGLTKGQASPTLKLGEKTKSLASPNPNYNVNSIGLAITSGFTFIARSYSYSIKHLVNTISNGITHRGLSFIQVLQPCPTYNDINTKDWYSATEVSENGTSQSRLYDLKEAGYDGVVRHGDVSELNEKITQALMKSLEWGKQIPIGVFYQNEIVSTYPERIAKTMPYYDKNPPAFQTISDREGKPTADIEHLLESFSQKRGTK